MGLADKRVVILGGTSGTGLQVGKLAAEAPMWCSRRAVKPKVDRAKDAVPERRGTRLIDLLSQSNIKTFFAKIASPARGMPRQSRAKPPNSC